MSYFFIFLSAFTFAHVVKDEILTTDKTTHSFKSVCEKMIPHESPLIEIVSGTVLDCMGKKITVGDFCEKELAQDPYYLRGYIDSTKKQVVCISGKKVYFKYQCVKLADKALCDIDSAKSCAVIKAKLARRLDLVHHSFTKNQVGIKELNCLFESLPLSEKKNGSL